MDFFRFSMRVLSGLLMIYFFLIMMNIIFSWFPSSSPGVMRIRMFIRKITDPYMRHFYGIRWLRFGVLDFSPVLGLIILSFVLYITQRLSIGGFPSAGELLIWLISTVWGLIAFIMTIFGLLMYFRLITLFVMKSKPGWIDRIDTFLFPRVSRIMGFFTHKSISYPLALGVSGTIFLIVRFLGDWLLVRFLYPLLIRI